MFNHSRSSLRAIRSLSRVMSRADAARLVGCTDPRAQVAVDLKSIGRRVVLRPAGADLKVLEKVFLSLDYELPFPDAPVRIVDAGAHIGLATLYFAHRYPAARVIAIEPVAENAAILRENCQGIDRITVIQAALWPRAANLGCGNPGADSWAFQFAEASGGTGMVPGIAPDAVMAGAGWDAIDLFKIDIEGAELELFSGPKPGWLRQVRSIAIELHDRVRPGCSRAFYDAIVDRLAAQEVRGENIFVKLDA